MSYADILVVEDEIIVAKNIQSRLEKVGYVVCAVVSSGEDAVKKAAEKHPDLVLMDIKLEGKMDGIEAAEHIHTQYNIPIVYLTAYADEKTLQRAKITEPYGYIIKPFEDRELQSNIEIALYKHKAEKRLKENREQLENIINSASEIIISIDKNNKIVTWNKTAETLTGYKQKEVLKKPITKLEVFTQPQELVETLQKMRDEQKIKIDELVLESKTGIKRILKVSHSLVNGDKKQDAGILFIGKDITSERESEEKLVPGNSYLISEKLNKSALMLFLNLTKTGYKGLYITRNDPKNLYNMIPSVNVEVLLLKQTQGNKFGTISNLSDLTTKIQEFNKRNTHSVILLERIDYLLTRFSFEDFIETLYRINDIISENEALFLLHLDPSLLEKKTIGFY